MHFQLRLCGPALGALFLLGGCGDSKTETKPEATAASTESAMAPMAGGSAKSVVKAKSTGTVTALDQTAGKITLDHQAIPEASWPAMTMTFAADPTILTGVKVGDKVTFDAEIADSTGKVTALSKQ